jgi:glycerol uptake facilitator protein
MSPFLAEFIGTAILVILGNGVVSNVVLNRTKGNNAGWIVITWGWGMAVFVGVWVSMKSSGAHLNPAVTIALAAARKFPWKDVPLFIAAQMIGAFLGACLVYLTYRDHFDATEDPAAKLACFSTGPNIRNPLTNFFSEFLGTFVLLLPIFLMNNPDGLGTLGALQVGLLVFAIGMSLGGTTGYAINPARDLGPRIAHFVLPIRNKGSSDWEYAWIPVVGPICGGLVAAGLARALLHT